MRKTFAFRFVAKTAVLACALAGAAATHAQTQAPLKVGFMLPATGTFAALGDMIEKGFKLYVDEQGGKLGGRTLQFFKVDDESEPSKATDNVNKLIKRDQVDVIVGTVHSGVALAMAKGRHPDLLARLNLALATLRRDGRWQQIHDRWMA